MDGDIVSVPHTTCLLKLKLVKADLTTGSLSFYCVSSDKVCLEWFQLLKSSEGIRQLNTVIVLVRAAVV